MEQKMSNPKSKESSIEVKEELEISDPEKILIILHDKKREILKCIFQEGKTIQEIRDETGINPGTIKRHLTDLEKSGLVFLEAIKRNDYNIKIQQKNIKTYL